MLSASTPADLGDWVAFWLFVLACVVVGEVVRYRRDEAERKAWRDELADRDRGPDA